MAEDSFNEEYLEENQNQSEDDENGNQTLTEGTTSEKKSIQDAKFVDILISFGKTLLEKSQVPAMKQKKKTAMHEVCIQMLVQHGINMTVRQVMKKINNMKQRIKVKTDRRQTGNRKIILNELERKFFDLMGGVENPSTSKCSCKTLFLVSFQMTRQRHPIQSIGQKTILEEQLKLIKAQQEYTAQLQTQQNERHEKEMELLVLKRKLTLLLKASVSIEDS
ncbi:uncharacterized protein LOC135702922 [Ochlerotatus camptorhynchus]|uniref:uncharacterized protein LOC135702922 n=1 Tax=Ochlerotatus camptorhynchus TaxID=644619 RepID=UPI0031D47314